MKKNVGLLLGWILLAAVECAGFHSLGFLSTGRFHPGTRLYFEQVTVFDGVLISHCDSRTQQEQFKAVLESHNLIRTCENAQYDVYDALEEISKFINGTLYVQRRRGCTRSAEGLNSAFEIWAVNGEDFIQFDADHQEWEALADTALTTRDSWNNLETRNHDFGSFLKDQCPEMIQRIKLREVEQRTDLCVFLTPIDRFQTLLKCHVTSTDKSLRSLSLTEDGASRAHRMDVRGPLPSVDGSVVLRLTAVVPLGYSNIYGCVVPTGGGPITVMWDGKTLDGRDIHYASIYWIPLYILGSLAFLGALLAWPIWCWCLRSPRVRRFLKLEKTIKNEPSKNVVKQPSRSNSLQNMETGPLTGDSNTSRSVRNVETGPLTGDSNTSRGVRNVETGPFTGDSYASRSFGNVESGPSPRDSYASRSFGNVGMGPFPRDSHASRSFGNVGTGPFTGDSSTSRGVRNVETGPFTRDSNTSRGVRNVEMGTFPRDSSTSRGVRNVETGPFRRDSYTSRGVQNVETGTFPRDSYTSRSGRIVETGPF